MTKVKFIEDLCRLEYQNNGSMPERFPHYRQVPLYPYSPVFFSLSTQRFLHQEKPVFSSDFLPSRVFAKIFPG
jgi:hypothetical protein